MPGDVKNYQTKEYWNERVKRFIKMGDLKNLLFITKRFDDYTKRAEALLKAIVEPNWRFLDVGCGYGRFYPIIRKIGARYVGIDFSEEMIRLAREKYPTGDFRIMSWENINDLGKFDCIFENNCLHSFGNKEKFIKTIKKNISKDGCYILSELNCIEIGYYYEEYEGWDNL